MIPPVGRLFPSAGFQFQAGIGELKPYVKQSPLTGSSLIDGRIEIHLTDDFHSEKLGRIHSKRS